MSETATQIKRIQDKLQQLLKQHANLQRENAQLKELLNQSKQQNSSNLQNIEHLKQKVDVLKLHAGEMPEADRKELEKRINIYLKEIDRCIALLGE